MKIALLLRILAMKIFVNVDQMHDVQGRQIRVKRGLADVVRMVNAQKNNIVTSANAKVCDFQSPNILKHLF